jgi:anti-sigma factor RsiW
MLQLILERGQRYEDIGSLLGLSADEVRARARTALGEMGGADPDRDVALTDYLLGQADPIGRADVARHLGSDPEARELADQLSAQLRVIAPGARLPEIPTARGRAARAAAPPTAGDGVPASGGPAAGLSVRQRRMIAGLIGAGIVVAAVVLLVTGTIGGGDDEEPSQTATAPQAGGDNPPGGSGGLTRAELRPVGDSNAAGIAAFARVRQGQSDVPVVQVTLTRLEPSAEGEVYVVWLAGPNDRAFPLSRDEVGENGDLRGIVPLQSQLLQALSAGAFDEIIVTRASQDAVLAELRDSGNDRRLPELVGDPVLRGEITGPGFPVTSQGSNNQGGAG